MQTATKLRCLIVDDDDGIRKLCLKVAEAAGFVCAQADCADTALQMIEVNPPDVVLSDMVLPDVSGIELLRQTRQRLPHVEVAVMTGYGSIETAIQATRLGAFDYITKPFSLTDLKALLLRMQEKASQKAEQLPPPRQARATAEIGGIIGSSPKVQEVLRLVDRVKDLRMPVLITGESGTGKELVTRALHESSSYAKKPFVVVDCGALVPTLIESELFGYEKGAFTGAATSKQGLFQYADGGTIFLDEIGELPLEMQTKLLRVLQQKEVRPVGSHRCIKVDVRVIAATNRDLETEYREGRFRKDLFFRLNVVGVQLPSLRERRDDIPQLVRHFLQQFGAGRDLNITTEAMEALLRYDWPGNIRELENCIERAAALGNGDNIQLADLPLQVQNGTSAHSSSFAGMQSPDATPARATEAISELEKVERDTILRLLQEAQGDKVRTQALLGVSRATLYRKLKRYNIPTFEMGNLVSA